MSNKSKNEKDGKEATEGNQVKVRKTAKHITIREATDEDYRKLQYWNVGTFYRVTQSGGKENMAMFKITAKGKKPTNYSIPEASADDPIYTRGFAIGEMRSRSSSKVTEEEAPQQAQQPRVSQGSSQNVKTASRKVKRNNERNRRQD